MASRPRRSAAAKATENISVQSKWADGNETSERSPMPSRRSGRAAARDVSSPESQGMPANRSRQAARNSRRSGEIVRSQRSRGAKKNYVIDSSPDEDEEEIEDEVEVELDEDEAMDDEDAEGEEMDVDAEGEDAEGDIDMDAAPPKRGRQTIKVNPRSSRSRPAARAAAARIVPDDDDDDDDDELSEPADSDLGDGTMGFGDETMADEDAEGEEIEVAGDGEEDDEEDDEDEEEDEEEGDDDDEEEAGEGQEAGDGGDGGALDSDEDGSREGTPDFAKMTKRQRARFEEPQEYMKLSDEVQAKKVFTAEELSMRRQEMARRRRNLSEKRNEEVKMETINKLLKKQAPKVSKKSAMRGDSPDSQNRPDITLIRWVSSKNGIKVAVPEEIIAGPVGDVFTNGKRPAPKVVEEVA